MTLYTCSEVFFSFNGELEKYMANFSPDKFLEEPSYRMHILSLIMAATVFGIFTPYPVTLVTTNTSFDITAALFVKRGPKIECIVMLT